MRVLGQEHWQRRCRWHAQRTIVSAFPFILVNRQGRAVLSGKFANYRTRAVDLDRSHPLLSLTERDGLRRQGATYLPYIDRGLADRMLFGCAWVMSLRAESREGPKRIH